jgi:hypothetical protein
VKAYKESRADWVEESRQKRLDNCAEISKGNRIETSKRYPIIYAGWRMSAINALNRIAKRLNVDRQTINNDG